MTSRMKLPELHGIHSMFSTSLHRAWRSTLAFGGTSYSSGLQLHCCLTEGRVSSARGRAALFLASGSGYLEGKLRGIYSRNWDVEMLMDIKVN
jgi:hypothetical protein